MKRQGIIVDLFAGGGGASSGIEQAGLKVDVAINHNPIAIAIHKANHPNTKHFLVNVFEVDPRIATRNRPVGLLWASPDCTHFSRAKGGTPVKKEIRGLAWVVIRWAALVMPRVIILENVSEFEGWGPLKRKRKKDKQGQPENDRDGNPLYIPNPKYKGRTFKEWVSRLRTLGYQVEWRCLRACDYGSPTIRKRLFLIARCDGQPIQWPTPTHGPGRIPYRTAAEIIDWEIPTTSIFDRPRPLVLNTNRRIAQGMRKYVLDAAEPFIITYYGSKKPGGDWRGVGMGYPLPTQTTENRFSLDTITTKNGHALVIPYLVQTGYTNDVKKPLGTVVAGGVKQAVVSAFIAQHNTGVIGRTANAPLSTITSTGSHQQPVAAFLSRQFGKSVGSALNEPMGTVTAGGGGKTSLVSASFLAAYYSSGGQHGEMSNPIGTIVSKDRWLVVKADLTTQIDPDLRDAAQRCARFVEEYDPTTGDHCPLYLEVGENGVVWDIGMRMLQPEELEQAQGFRRSYKIAVEINRKPISKAAQVSAIGNSVPPDVAEALISANMATQQLSLFPTSEVT